MRDEEKKDPSILHPSSLLLPRCPHSIAINYRLYNREKGEDKSKKAKGKTRGTALLPFCLLPFLLLPYFAPFFLPVRFGALYSDFFLRLIDCT